MPKQLITIIGLIVTLGVVALGVSAVAAPLVAQAFAVDAQTASVAATNATYETQLATLQEQQKHQDEIQASVDALRKQIPGSDQFDDVFEVVGNAAAASGVTIVSVTAGDVVAFAPRTAADASETAAAPAPAPAPSPSASAEGSTTDTTTDAAAAPTTPVGGRQQVDFAISVTATSMDQVTAFLDALRGGPRLLSNIETSATTSGEDAIDVQVKALAYTDAEG
ncbi:hypothetical protein ACH3VR_19210 [Microbacterium sp. B2969]|uniref:Tfp pilus assembly protein PilO n=1 Tax=Microbacterium alkaliflavum TaxID=3248839 RepID=A0ABW7QCA0_9MICO